MTLTPRDILGCPWRPGGRIAIGPDRGLDCWGVVRALRPDVPDYAVDPGAAADVMAAFAEGRADPRWRVLDFPEQGCVVGMGARNGVGHAGLWWRGRVVHIVTGGQVRADAPPVLAQLGIPVLTAVDWRP